MSASSLASIQFAYRSPVSIGVNAQADREAYSAVKDQTGETNPVYQGPEDVVPLSASTLSSADRTTAWRLQRNLRSRPQPYSARTAGSIYKFNDQ